MEYILVSARTPYSILLIRSDKGNKVIKSTVGFSSKAVPMEY